MASAEDVLGPGPGPEAGSRRPRRRSFNPRYPAWLTSPSLLYYAIFFLGPLAILVAFSLATQTGFNAITYGFDTSQYHLVLDSLYIKIFWRTLVMAGIGSLLTMVVGYPIAYWMARYLSTYKMLALLLVLVPFWTSFLIRTYALKIILDSQGLLAKYTGIDIMYTKYAVGVGLVYNYLPLFIIPVFASLERMDWSLVEAAEDLGDSPLRAFRRITVPLATPGIVAGSLLVFIPMMGEYLNPVLLGGDKTIYAGNLIGQQFLLSRDWPFGSAIAMVLILSMTIVVLVYARITSR
jgi:spermidine/putrescine transport system permease protein